MKTITINLTDEQIELLESYAARVGANLADMPLWEQLQMLEDAEDARDADEAYSEYEKNPVSYSLEEVSARLGI